MYVHVIKPYPDAHGSTTIATVGRPIVWPKDVVTLLVMGGASWGCTEPDILRTRFGSKILHPLASLLWHVRGWFVYPNTRKVFWIKFEHVYLHDSFDLGSFGFHHLECVFGCVFFLAGIVHVAPKSDGSFPVGPSLVGLNIHREIDILVWKPGNASGFDPHPSTKLIWCLKKWCPHIPRIIDPARWIHKQWNKILLMDLLMDLQDG